MDQKTFNARYGYISKVHDALEKANNMDLTMKYIKYVTLGLEFDSEHKNEDFGAVRDELGKKIDQLVKSID